MLRSLSTISLVLALTVLSSACSRNSSGPIQGPVHKSEEGGINGGGGGTLPANPISKEEAFKIISTAKDDLLPALKEQSFILNTTNPSSVYKKLFLGSPTIWEVLYTTNIEIPMDRACKDAYGHDVDGSAHASKPGMICISAFRIAPKLIKERARTEVVALIGHELCHVLGCDEAEARELQSGLARNLAQVVPKPEPEKFLAVAQSTSEAASRSVSSIVDRFEKLSNESLFEAIWSAEFAIRAFEYKARDLNQAALTNKELTYFNLQRLRFQLATNYVRMQPGMPNAAQYQKEYEKVFAAKDQLMYEQYLIETDSRSPFDVTDYDAEFIRRIHNSAELKQAIVEVGDYLNALSESMRQANFGSRPNYLPDPNRPITPWSAFVGDYEVVSADCTPGNVHQNTIGYSVTPVKDQPGKFRLVQHFQNGYGDQGGLENGADVIMGGAAVFVTGGSDWAERQYEAFDRWGNRGGQDFAQNTVRIEKNETGFSLRETVRGISWKQNVAHEWETSCNFTLRKK